MCLHLQETIKDLVGGTGEGSLHGELSTFNLETLPWKEQGAFQSVVWSQEPRGIENFTETISQAGVMGTIQLKQNCFNFTLCYLLGENNFLANSLLWMPQYNCLKVKVVKRLLPSCQLVAQITTWAQTKEKWQIDNEVTTSLKAALKSDKWFQNHGNVCSTCSVSAQPTAQNRLAWIGAKLYVPKSQRLMVLGKSHNSKAAGHCGFIKTLHLVKRLF